MLAFNLLIPRGNNRLFLSRIKVYLYVGSAEKVEKYMIIRYLEGRKGTTSARFLVNKVENVCIFTIHFCYPVVE